MVRSLTRSTTWKMFERESVGSNLHIYLHGSSKQGREKVRTNAPKRNPKQMGHMMHEL